MYIKKKIYEILTTLGMDPDRWEICKDQNRLLELTNKMLDINYLYKRI